MSASDHAEVEIGTAPSGPQRLTRHEWIAVVKRAFKEFLADDAMGLSQQIAYSSLLAFFPAMVFLVGFLGLIDAYEPLEEFLAPVAPQAVTDLLANLQESTSNEGTSATAFVLGAFFAVWAASGAMNTVVKAVNKAYERVETRPFWKVRITSIVLVVATGFVTAFMLLMIVVGGPLGEAIASKANLGGAWDWVWNLVRWPLAFCIVLLFFAFVYYLAPDVDVRDWKWVTPGSLIGSVLWLVLSGLFALYANYVASYNETYGTLAGGIVLLLWLNYSAFALLFGAELNSELDRQAEIRAAGGPNAGLLQRARRV